MRQKIRRNISRALVFCSFMSLVLATVDAGAYIPRSQTITARLAKNHGGRGTYIIEQDVQFRTSGEPIVLREKWLVENGESMRLSVSLPQGTKSVEPVRFEAVYKSGKKTLTDPNGGAVKSAPVGGEFFEPFFHVRSGGGFTALLIRAKLVGPGFGAQPPRPQKIEQIKRMVEPQVRLGRTGGAVAWVFGEPTPLNAAKPNPAVYIEQDSFLLRKIRFPSDAELLADRYSTFTGNLSLPRERTITWENNFVTIRVVSVKTATGATKALDPASVTVSAGRLPDYPLIREFYSRFR